MLSCADTDHFQQLVYLCMNSEHLVITRVILSAQCTRTQREKYFLMCWGSLDLLTVDGALLKHENSMSSTVRAVL